MQDRAQQPLLEVSNLSASFGGTQVLRSISFNMRSGESVALVGESGSGKSTLLKTIAGLAPKALRVDAGGIRYAGQDVLGLRGKTLRAYRCEGAKYVFQNGQESFDPLFSVGRQFDESLRAHGMRADAGTKLELLERMGVTDGERVLSSLPSELSGGLCQRVALAIALAGAPQLLLADEPTSALDSDNRKKVANLLRKVNEVDGVALLLVTHDIELAAELAPRIMVMHDGEIVESGSREEVLERPRDPYTRTLVESVPKMERNYRRVAL